MSTLKIKPTLILNRFWELGRQILAERDRASSRTYSCPGACVCGDQAPAEEFQKLLYEIHGALSFKEE